MWVNEVQEIRECCGCTVSRLAKMAIWEEPMLEHQSQEAGPILELHFNLCFILKVLNDL